jgi:hypothetical protein
MTDRPNRARALALLAGNTPDVLPGPAMTAADQSPAAGDEPFTLQECADAIEDALATAVDALTRVKALEKAWAAATPSAASDLSAAMSEVEEVVNGTKSEGDLTRFLDPMRHRG